jgi:integrase/recombinase XerD
VNEHLLKDVAEDLYFPLNTREETRGVFSVEEMQDFLEVITLEGANGQRDRAIFELMYCSGLRSGELCALTLDDVDLKERMLLIRLGKGRKDRLVPFSETALSFLKLYLEVERKRVLCTVPKEDKEVFFLSPYYGRLNKNRIGKLFLKYLKDSGVEKQNRSVHSIRHSTATHLLLAGADVRFVSELLGHSEVKATVRYTHLEKENLKKAYRKAHPRENDYYEEPDEKYLSDVAKLEKALLKSRERIKKRLAKMQEDVNLNTEENF